MVDGTTDVLLFHLIETDDFVLHIDYILHLAYRFIIVHRLGDAVGRSSL